MNEDVSKRCLRDAMLPTGVPRGDTGGWDGKSNFKRRPVADRVVHAATTGFFITIGRAGAWRAIAQVQPNLR
jgi:hypothetical protein